MGVLNKESPIDMGDTFVYLFFLEIQAVIL